MRTLDALWDELQKGRIFECSVRSDEAQVYGLHDDGNIFIDPRPSILDTLVHELLHRRYPELSERAVRRRTARLVRRMDESTKNRWYAAYNRLKRKRRPKDIDEV